MEELTAAWNLAYTGYFYPVHFSPADMSRHLSLWDVHLGHSLVARAGRQWAGVSHLAVRGRQGWIGGFGIAPDCRGQGLSHKLLAEQIAVARDLGLDGLRLEVLYKNVHARRVYAAGGFGVLREVALLRGQLPGGWPPPSGAERAFPVAVPEALNRLQALHPTPHTWQRQRASLEHQADGAGALACAPTPADRGAVLYRRRGDQVSILDIAATGPNRGQTVRALLQGISAAGEGRPTGRLLNEPDEPGSLLPELLAAGLAEVDRQHEMIWQRDSAAQ